MGPLTIETVERSALTADRNVRAPSLALLESEPSFKDGAGPQLEWLTARLSRRRWNWNRRILKRIRPSGVRRPAKSAEDGTVDSAQNLSN